MKLKPLLSNKYVKFLSNKYIFIALLFVIWMLFIDSNSWLTHRTLDKELYSLEQNKEYYKQEIAKDEKLINVLEDSTGLEKYARKTYFMKRENEDIYIIEHQNKLSNDNE